MTRNILRRSGQAGFIRTLVLIIVLILVLFYLGVDVNHLIEVVGNFFKSIIDIVVSFVKSLAESIKGAA